MRATNSTSSPSVKTSRPVRSKAPGLNAPVGGIDVTVPGPSSSPAGSVNPPTRVPNATTVIWRMLVPPSAAWATTVIWFPPRASGTVASKGRRSA